MERLGQEGTLVILKKDQAENDLSAIKLHVHYVDEMIAEDFPRTGMRVGEGLGLQWPDVNHANREIRVDRALSLSGAGGRCRLGSFATRTGSRSSDSHRE